MERADTPTQPWRRLLEIGTGTASGALVTAPVWGALWIPELWALFFGAFSAYWLYRMLSLTGFAVWGERTLRRHMRRDWLSAAASQPGWERLQHLVVFPTYGEPIGVLIATLDHLAGQDFPLERVHAVLAFEARDAQARDKAQALSDRFGDRFGSLTTTFHCERPGEVRGKSANLAYAVPIAAARLRQRRGFGYDDVLVTVCDADSRLHPKYLSALAHGFLTALEPEARLWQPVVLFHANLDRLPLFLRALDGLYSLVHVARLRSGFTLRTESTYSLSLATCHRVGYWDADVIPEDSHMFFKVFFRLEKPVRVEPVFLPVWADAAEGATASETWLSHYRQARRWSWGVSDVPYLLYQIWQCGTGRSRRLLQPAHYLEEHLLWHGHWFVLAGGYHLLPQLAPDVTATPLGTTALFLASLLFSLGAPCLVIAAWLDWRLRGAPIGLEPLTATAVSWYVLPFVGLAVSVLPALDSHTRLLFGWYLKYEVTAKQVPATVAVGAARSRATVESTSSQLA